jgi:hypothetical protein
VPVALIFVELIVWELVVLELFVEELIVVKNPVIALNTFVAKFPVTVTLLAVVDAIVELPDTFRFVKNPVAKAAIFPRIFVTVVLPKVDEPTVKKLAATSVPVLVDDPVLIAVDVRFVVEILVDVLFVIVPFVELILVNDKLPADKVVIVALVIVEFVTFSPMMFATEIFEVDAFDVEAFVVEA